MWPLKRFALFVAVFLFLPRTHSVASPAIEHLKIAAAADMRFVLDVLVKAFRESSRNKGVAEAPFDVDVTYGSSGNLATQLIDHAPFDLFLSADSKYSKVLVERGLVYAPSGGQAENGGQTEFCYGRGKIVLWVPVTSHLDLEKQGMKAFLDPKVQKIAIANPAHAPYGRAAEEAMRNAGVYDRIKERLVFGENVGQAAQFVQTGSADIGVIAQGFASAPEMKREGRYWEIPSGLYSRLDQYGVILKNSSHRDLAIRFKEFLFKEKARDILTQYGY